MISYEFRDIVVRYVNEDVSLFELEEWLVPKMESFLKSQASSDIELVSEIELGLAEINDKIITEKEFRERLMDFINQSIFVFSFPITASSASNMTTTSKIEVVTGELIQNYEFI